MHDDRYGSKTAHDFCPGGGGTVNQYSESEVGGLTLSDWDHTETSDKITLTKYKGDQVNVVIPSEFAEAPGKSVEIATFTNMFDKKSLVSLKIGTSDQKVTLGTNSLYGAFGSWSYRSLVTLDLSGLDTTKVTNMSSMFTGCSALQNLDLSGFDTSNVTNMQRMFMNCYSLESLDLSSFDTSSVTDMSNMFTECRALQNLDLSGFDTSNVTDMHCMFMNCYSLESLDLSSFDTSSVTDMSNMFTECRALQNLDLSGFDTSNVTNMQGMFAGCYNLESLDLSSFDTSNVIYMNRLLSDCRNLSIINLSNSNISENCIIDALFSFGWNQMLDYTIPTLIITSDQRIINEVVTDVTMMACRTPYHAEAKVIYNSNHEVFDDGNTMVEKTIHQSDRFVYSSLEEIKQEFTFDVATILKDSPKLADKEGFVSTWYLDEACTMPLAEIDMIDFTTLEDGTLQLYAGYKEVTPEEPETPEEKPTEPEETPSEPEEKPTEPQDQPNTPNEEEKEESNIEEIKKEESEAVHTGDEVSKGMYYLLLGGSMIVFATMLRKNRRSEQ